MIDIPFKRFLKKPTPPPPEPTKGEIISRVSGYGSVSIPSKSRPPSPPKPTTGEMVSHISGYGSVSIPAKDRPTPTPEPVVEPEPKPKIFFGVPLPPTVPKPKEYTKTQFIQLQQEQIKDIRETKKDIDPSAKYRVPMIGSRHVSQEELKTHLATKPKGWIPQYQIFTGAEVIDIYEKQHQDIRQYIVKISEYPAETKFKKIDTGYEVHIPPQPQPDLSLEWSKKELQKIEKAYEIHPLLGATAEFGFGAVSTFAALGKPLAQLFVDKPLPHYLSPLDIAFEPLGWSPPGSAKLIGERPIAMAGGIWGETLQLVGFHYTIKGVGTGFKIGVKGVVKRVPQMYGKFTQVFPEEKIITGFGKKVTTAPFGKTIYRWGAKGYVPGKQFIQVGTKEIRGPIKGLTYKETLFKLEKGRIWMSPEEVAKFKTKLAATKTLDIGFPVARTTAGVGKVEMVADITAFKVGFRKVIKTYGFALGERQIGVRVPAYGYRITPIITKEAGVQPTRASWLQFGRAYYGVPKQPYLKTIGPGFIPEKAWHRYVLRSAFKEPVKSITDVGAYQTLIYKPPTLVFKPHTFPFKAPATSYLTKISVPIKPLFVSPLALPLLGVKGIQTSLSDIELKFEQALTPEYALTQETLSAQKLEKITESALKLEQITTPSLETAQASALISETVELPALEQEQALVQLQALELKTLLQFKAPTVQQIRIKQPKLAQPFTQKMRIPFIFPLFPSDIKEKRIIEKPGQGFAVEIKERYIFSGKKVREEKFSRVKIHSLSQQDALALGGYLVDQSVSRSFKVTTVSGKPKPLGFDIPRIGYKFYKKDDVFIEDTPFAIDSPGEYEGITAKGILASMKRQKREKAPVSMKKPRVSREIRPSKGIYDIDFLQPNIDFNKNLREFENLFRRFDYGF